MILGYPSSAVDSNTGFDKTVNLLIKFTIPRSALPSAFVIRRRAD
ncbi:hypothetical protein QO005_003071 [Rhizobium paknamense]|uniref:Uncharacterized protein n=1 Tax=Rhizobium paknamense TaxID=1206817 RepID=A0ABU0IHL9_9HYPH|nr:hypothetical protein [Rhizobium paknamense]